MHARVKAGNQCSGISSGLREVSLLLLKMEVRTAGIKMESDQVGCLTISSVIVVTRASGVRVSLTEVWRFKSKFDQSIRKQLNSRMD